MPCLQWHVQGVGVHASMSTGTAGHCMQAATLSTIVVVCDALTETKLAGTWTQFDVRVTVYLLQFLGDLQCPIWTVVINNDDFIVFIAADRYIIHV